MKVSKADRVRTFDYAIRVEQRKCYDNGILNTEEYSNISHDFYNNETLHATEFIAHMKYLNDRVEGKVVWN